MPIDLNVKSEIATALCRKKCDISFESCYQQNNNTLRPCRNYTSCRINEKSIEQLNFLMHDLKCSSFLCACPGSGKTETVGLKAAYEITKWQHSPSGIAILTFTRSAADVIVDRICKFTASGDNIFPHYVGTFDSWVHKYIAQPFGHLATGYKGENGDRSITLIDSDADAGFLHSYKTKYSYKKRNPKANQYYWDPENKSFYFNSGDRSLDYELNNLEFPEYGFEDLKKTKERFLGDGYATYEDVTYIALSITEDNETAEELSKRFPVIIVDECQDLSWKQMEILKNFAQQGTALHFVGDLNQAIWAFRKTYPQKVDDFINKHNFFKLALTQNFRCSQPIVDLCSKIIPSPLIIKGIEPEKGKTATAYIPFKKEEIGTLVEGFCSYLKKLGIPPDSSAVLSRGKPTIAKLKPCYTGESKKTAEYLALAIKFYAIGNNIATLDSLELLGFFLAYKGISVRPLGKSTCYCPRTQTSKMAWRIFLSRLLEALLSDPKISNLELNWQDWTKEVRENFIPIIANISSGVEGLKLDKLVLNAPPNRGNITVATELPDAKITSGGSPILLSTIHKIKGETLDAVMLVSSLSKGGDGGHWSHWLDKSTENGEYARFAYVACSRPRKLLIWAVPNPSTEDQKILDGLGLKKISFSACDS